MAMKPIPRVLTAIAAMISLEACSLFGPRMQTITVSSDPLGANVIVNGERVGHTPLRSQVRRGEDLLIEVREPGYSTEYRTTHRTLSTLGIMDVIGGWIFLVPFIGLVSPAAWKHEPATFGFILAPEGEAAP